MTSNHSFFKIMKEDLRHKYWMLALSILANFLMIVVFYLLTASERQYAEEGARAYAWSLQACATFFDGNLKVAGGVVAIAGAIIVGLGSFRYLFHRDMVDTWHSMPVKRREIFFAGWLNGFLIWFVPYFLCTLLSLIMAILRMNSLFDKFAAAPDRTKELIERVNLYSVGATAISALLTTLLLILIFFMVYHLVLVAVMFAGNILNAIVLTVVGGCGVIGLYALWYIFSTIFLDTFWEARYSGIEWFFDASPLASAVWILVLMEQGSAAPFWRILLVNAILAIALLFAAWAIYEKRPSELAEQGTKNRAVRIVVRAVVSVAAGLGGWLFFYLIGEQSETMGLYWGIFGGVLAAVLSYGVMNIVFSMEFRGFLRGKIGMAVTAVCVVIIGSAYYFDWTGYNTYLPKKESIESISLLDTSKVTRWDYLYNYDVDTNGMNQMVYTDVDTIYDFLTGVTANYNNDNEQQYTNGSETVYVKVNLNSGKSYYRIYQIYAGDEISTTAAKEILLSDTYLKTYYEISDENYKNIEGISFYQDGFGSQSVKRKSFESDVATLYAAYHKDIEENPESVVFAKGKVYSEIDINVKNSSGYRIFVTEGMSNTRQALKDLGFSKYAEDVDVAELSAIRIYSGFWSGDTLDEGQTLVDYVRSYYGCDENVDGTESEAASVASQTENAEVIEDVTESAQEESASAKENSADASQDFNVDMTESASLDAAAIYISGTNEIYLTVTDPDEMKELLDISSYVGVYMGDVFGETNYSGNFILVFRDGTEQYVYPGSGRLPEKYIERFADVTLE